MAYQLMMTTEITVNGMTCEKCEEIVETAINMVDAVESVDADRYEQHAIIEGDVDNPAILVEKVQMAGYDGAA